LFGSVINIKKNDSCNIIHDLIKFDNLESFKKLIYSDFNKDLKFNAKDSIGNAPIHYSVMSTNQDFLKLLLKQKNVKIDSENENGMNIFHLSCQNGNDKILNYLLTLEETKDFIYKTSKIGYSPLHYAVNSCSTQCILKLIDYESKLSNIQDVNGDTPLHIAIRKNNIQIIYYLSNLTDLNLFNKKNEVLKNLMKNIDFKSFFFE
jgi:ankyrin repeat protein